MSGVGDDFENAVRHLARLKWPSGATGGAEMVDGRERDGVFVTDEAVHGIEATTSRRKGKAEKDGQKLAQLGRRMEKSLPLKPFVGWLITKEEPTAEQRQAVFAIKKKSGIKINCVSFDTFRKDLVDARDYSDLRERYPFGSLRDPSANKPVFNLEYVDRQFVNLDVTDAQQPTGLACNTKQLAEMAAAGERLVVLGEYGAGKSATMRELFLALRKRFRKDNTKPFPILLNLRDHLGQTEPAEALGRHARAVGYPAEHHLVRAWRGGYAHILLGCVS